MSWPSCRPKSSSYLTTTLSCAAMGSTSFCRSCCGAGHSPSTLCSSRATIRRCRCRPCGPRERSSRCAAATCVFPPAETAHYLNQSLISPPDDKTIATVQERAEGWIAGIKLATLSLDTGTSTAELVAALASSDVDVTEYLADEVFAGQPPAIQGFLLQTAILDHFCASLCTAVMAEPITGPITGEAGSGWGAETCIEWLVRANLFTVALDGTREWYRYHHLFRDMLRRRGTFRRSAATPAPRGCAMVCA
jgi:hypothetical protein